MRYLALACIIFSSCSPEIHMQELDNISNMHVLAQNNFSWDVQEDYNIIINAPDKPRLKDLRSQVLVISSPEDEILKNIPQEKSIAFGLKTFEKPGFFSLVPKKKQLVAGNYYGLYMRENQTKLWELKYLFYINYSQPKLVNHNVGERVSKNRINFSFKFDQAIKVLSDQALVLKGESVHAPPISSLRVMPDGRTLVVSLESDVQFIEKETYFFVFDKIVNLDNKKIIVEPIEFVTTEAQENLKIIKEISLDASTDSAEVVWHLNNNFNGELYFGEDLSGNYNCLAQSCPRMARVWPSLKPDKSFLGRHFITGLNPKTAYYYILRAEDHQGQILIAGGVFKTRANPSLRFSELLINPQKKPEHKAEFIEFFYDGLEPKKFENLKLIFESPENLSEECVLASFENQIQVRPKNYVLIVGHDFDEGGAQVPTDTVIVRLPKKSLCGGLANEKPKSIKLVDEEGMIDHYGGHLWPTPQGVSVLRRDLRGLDEFDNYCYSDAARGPTPGGPN